MIRSGNQLKKACRQERKLWNGRYKNYNRALKRWAGGSRDRPELISLILNVS
jgi:hypothetical protein